MPMPGGAPPRMPPPKMGGDMGGDMGGHMGEVAAEEKNAMVVGMAVLRGEVDLASLEPDIAEMVIAVLDKYHPGWQKSIGMKAQSPMKPGMPPMQGGRGPMASKPSNAPVVRPTPPAARPGAPSGSPMRPPSKNAAPSGAKPFGMK
jgi:hypothetical protein